MRQTLRLVLCASLFGALLARSAAADSTSATCPISGSDRDEGSEEHGSQFIVRFRDYLMSEDHHARLSAALPDEGVGWQWVPRANKASMHPTDFGLIRLLSHGGGTNERAHAATPSSSRMGMMQPSSAPPQHQHEALEAGEGTLRVLREMVSGMAFVRDVHTDRRFTGKLNWVPEGDLKAAFLDLNLGGGVGSEDSGWVGRTKEHGVPGDSGVGGGILEGGLWEEATAEVEEHEVEDDWLLVSKRPGRRSTRFMMEGEEEVMFSDTADDDDGDIDDATEAEEVQDGVAGREASTGSSRRGLMHRSGASGESTATMAGGGRRKGGMMMDPDGGDEGLLHPRHHRRHGRRTQHRISDPGSDLVGHSSSSSSSSHSAGGRGMGTSHRLREGEEVRAEGHRRRGRAVHGRGTVTSLMGAEELWKQGFSGKGVKVWKGGGVSGFRSGRGGFANRSWGQRALWAQHEYVPPLLLLS